MSRCNPCRGRRPRTALHAASLACLATVACDLLAIAGLGPSVLASGTAATGLVLVAAMASLVRLVLVGASWRRCHTTLATLG